MGETTPATKPCGTCRQVLPLDAFNIRRASVDGRCARCRSCDSEYKKAHRAKLPEQHKAADTARYRRDREKRLAGMKVRYDRDRDKICEKTRAKRAADPEGVRAAERAYRAANPEKIKALKRRYYDAHAEQIRAKRVADYAADPATWIRRTAEWQRANPDLVNERNHRRRARERAAPAVKITRELLAAKWTYWAGLCWMCRGPANSWDHVKPLVKGGAHMLVNLRPACRSCNSAKGDRWPYPTGRRHGPVPAARAGTTPRPCP